MDRTAADIMAMTPAEYADYMAARREESALSGARAAQSDRIDSALLHTRY